MKQTVFECTASLCMASAILFAIVGATMVTLL
jgi:hypothetical protein